MRTGTCATAQDFGVLQNELRDLVHQFRIDFLETSAKVHDIYAAAAGLEQESYFTELRTLTTDNMKSALRTDDRSSAIALQSDLAIAALKEAAATQRDNANITAAVTRQTASAAAGTTASAAKKARAISSDSASLKATFDNAGARQASARGRRRKEPSLLASLRSCSRFCSRLRSSSSFSASSACHFRTVASISSSSSSSPLAHDSELQSSSLAGSYLSVFGCVCVSGFISRYSTEPIVVWLQKQLQQQRRRRRQSEICGGGGGGGGGGFGGVFRSAIPYKRGSSQR
eukprot:COSAG01_NODE_5452_length_4256_cov_3.523454_7_plen_287_part_00